MQHTLQHTATRTATHLMFTNVLFERGHRNTESHVTHTATHTATRTATHTATHCNTHCNTPDVYQCPLREGSPKYRVPCNWRPPPRLPVRVHNTHSFFCLSSTSRLVRLPFGVSSATSACQSTYHTHGHLYSMNIVWIWRHLHSMNMEPYSMNMAAIRDLYHRATLDTRELIGSLTGMGWLRLVGSFKL